MQNAYDDYAEPDVSIGSYVAVLRRRKWVVVGTTIAVAGAALAFGLAQTPQYEAEAQLIIQRSAAESEFGNVASDQARTLSTELELLRSPVVLDKVAETVGVGVEDLPDISAQAVGQSNLVRVSVRDADPEYAVELANDVAKTYLDYRRTQIIDQLTQAATEIQQRLDDTQGQLDAVEAQIASRGGGAATPDADLDELQRNLFSQTLGLRQTLTQIQVSKELRSGPQLVRLAVVPDEPVAPQPLRTASLGLVIGLMLGVGLAFLMDAIDDRVRDRDGVERASGRLPVLAMIPTQSGGAAAPVFRADPHSLSAEAYRSLRTALESRTVDRPSTVVQVTSAGPDEGRTTTSVNLACACAQAGLRVVVVDADLRNPMVHESFGLPNEVGLTDALRGEVDPVAALQTSGADPSVGVLTSGHLPSTPADLLSGGRLTSVLEQVRTVADIVIVDSPPVRPYTDALVVANAVDGVICIVSENMTRRKDLQRSLELLDQVGGYVLGTVVTRSRTSDQAMKGRRSARPVAERQSGLAVPRFEAALPQPQATPVPQTGQPAWAPTVQTEASKAS